MSDAERYARQIAEANTRTARRLADESRRRWSGVQADDGPFGKVWTDKSGRVIRGAPASAPPIYTYNSIEQLIPANTLTRIDFDQADFDDSPLITTGASWAYTADATSEGIYEVYATVGILIDSSDPDWLITDAAQLHLKVGSRTFSPFAVTGLDISGAADRQITLQGTGCNDLYTGDTIYANIELIGSATARATAAGSCRIHIKRYSF